MRYKFFLHISAVLFLIFVFSVSCSRELEVKPVSVITAASFWKTENDVQGALNGMYFSLREMNKMTYQLGEGRSEVMTFGIAGTGGYDLFYQNTLNPSNLAATGNYSAGVEWKGYYTIINTANLLIKYIPGISFVNPNDQKRALAQAYAMRAYIYFVMARTWGDLPLRLPPTEGYDPALVHLERSPVATVFEQIKSDITEALELFPDNSIPAGRYFWSGPSTNALKADVYLWTAKRLNGGTADYTAALNACTEAENADVTLLDNFADIFKYQNKGNREVLMAIRFQELEAAGFSYFRDMYMFAGLMPNNVSQYTRDLIGPTGTGHSVWSPSALVRNQFTADDTRRNASFYEIYSDEGGTQVYFTAAVMKGTGVVTAGGVREYVSDIIIYRLADVILMKAEAKNGLGQNPAGEVNRIRQRAYKDQFPAHTFVTGSPAQNDAAILKERLLELVFEGKRWWDLVRYDKAFEIVPSLQARASDRYLLLFPISTNTLSLEPKVKQNPGYE